MANWKLVDAWEMGYEYECPNCGNHIDVRSKLKDLPSECHNCGHKMDGDEKCE